MGYPFSPAQSPLPPPSRHGPSPGPSSPPPAAAPDPALVAQVLEGLPVPLVCLSHDDDHDAWLRLNAEAFAERRPFQGECRIVVDGEIRWVRAESVPRPLADGGTVWEGVLIDVTDRVVAQRRLEASEQRLRRLLDHLPIPVIAMGLEGQPEGLVHNHQFTASFGYPSGTLPDLATWLERAYPHPACRREASDRWQAALALARGGDGLVPADDYRIHAADGSERDVRISATLLDDRIVMVVADITERKRTERALVRLRRREQEQEERQRVRLQDKLRTSLMAAAVAHEINQPLSAILLNCKLALANAGSDHEAVLQQLVLDAEQVVRTIEKMRSLLRNVQTEHQPVDLVTVVDSSLLGVRAQLRSQAVTVDPQGLVGPCWIQGDGDQLTVAISNLLRNALEALAPGRGGQLGLTLERADGRAQLTIDDNGCGIPADLIANLPLRSTKAEGTGIGLYVVQRTVENHNGSLAFAASPLGGTRVRLCFPLLPS